MTSPPARSTGLRAAALALLVGAGLTGCGFSGSVDSGAVSSSTTAPAPPTATSPAGSATPSGSPGPTGSATPTRTTAAAPTGRPGTTPSPAPAPEHSGPDRCHTSELTGHLGTPDAGAGHRHATLVLTDTGGRTCTVMGYGGLGLLGADGTPLPSEQVRTASPAPQLVRLQPGGSVAATLSWTVVPTGPEPTSGACEPTPATLTVIPPDETDALTVPWSFGPVCGGGRIAQTAYAAG